MILLVDNYDSFSYNLFQLVGEINPDIMVIRNDEKTISEIRTLAPDHIILSPGPGRPENAGITIDIVKQLGSEIPILGVCLGHQAICAAYGAEITYARRLMHGKQSTVKLDNSCPRRASRHRGDNRRGGYGGFPHTLPGFRTTVPPGIHPDTMRKTNAEEFCEGDLSNDQRSYR